MILLIGCGNSLRRDDGAGPLLVRRIGRRCRRPDLAVLTCQQLTPELAPRLADPAIAAALFADAAFIHEAIPAAPLLRPLAAAPAPSPFGHLLPPAALLALTERLYGRLPPAWLVTVPAADFGFGRGLSPGARQQLHQRGARGSAAARRWRVGSPPGREMIGEAEAAAIRSERIFAPAYRRSWGSCASYTTPTGFSPDGRRGFWRCSLSTSISKSMISGR